MAKKKVDKTNDKLRAINGKSDVKSQKMAERIIRRNQGV